jgi:ABC-type glycerol-3-phosphate transport system permease component
VRGRSSGRTADADRPARRHRSIPSTPRGCDGASEAKAFQTIVLPLSWASIGTVTLIQGIAAWNELALAIVLLPRAARQTFQVGLVAFRRSSRSISARSSRA